jgi:hypothetical protein
MPGAVPTTSDYALSLDDIITAATERLPGEHKPVEIATARRAVQFAFARFAASGINLWTLEILVSLPLTLAVAQYDLPADTLDVSFLTYRDTAESDPMDIEVRRVSDEDYAAQPLKNDPGFPITAYLARGRDRPTLYVWPVPNRTTYEIRYTRVRKFRDLGNQLAAVDVPSMWLGILVAAVAYYLGLTRASLSLADREALKAVMEDEFLTVSVENRDSSPFRIEPDMASYYR